ncbi:MAG: hypothetical protein NT056_00685 [Proteobacteria bacterium]|nr:hypothetical protein [Pseudomonadota bacterium]
MVGGGGAEAAIGGRGELIKSLIPQFFNSRTLAFKLFTISRSSASGRGIFSVEIKR